MDGKGNSLPYVMTDLSPQGARKMGTNYHLPKTAAEVLNQVNFIPQCFHKVMPPRQYPFYEVSIWSDIGNRRTQEDRCIFCFQLIKGRSDTGFFGVFDGTVGDFASENVKHLVVPHLIGSPPWPRIVELIEAADRQGLRRRMSENCIVSAVSDHNSKRPDQQQPSLDGLPAVTNGSLPTQPKPGDCIPQQDEPRHQIINTLHTNTNIQEKEGKSYQESYPTPPSSEILLTEEILDKELPPLISNAMDWMYLNADTELVQLCAQNNKHYSSSTSVTVLLLAGYCCVGHLGDSRVALGYERMGLLYGEFLTMDHKPNLPPEQDRILRSGGSVEYLHNHNNKPFIRGGDFTLRKSKGEQPMQLQYSRAFGGKDLKMFGLSNEPDLRIFKLDPRHNVLILASDGIWDVQTAAKAVEIVLVARGKGEHPALSLITLTLNEQRTRNQNADNLTAIVVFLQHGQIDVKYEAKTIGERVVTEELLPNHHAYQQQHCNQLQQNVTPATIATTTTTTMSESSLM